MPSIALHEATQQRLLQFAQAPSHAVLITGAAGIGKLTVARYAASQVLDISEDRLDKYAYVSFVLPDDGKAISVAAVRQLEHLLSLKVPGTAPIRRVIIIDQAHTLTHEAQNALLKMLEEPPADTVFILTSPSVQQLLPTVRSRLQTIDVVKPQRGVLLEYAVRAGIASERLDAVYAISGGLPGLALALASDADHPLIASATKARELLGQTKYQRLLQVDRLAKDKQLTSDCLGLIGQMAHISLQTASGPAAQRWQHIMRASYRAAEALTLSAQPKLVLTNLCLNL